jgi:O-succinylbenzoate synthase
VAGALTVIQSYIFPLIKEASTYKQVLDLLKKVRGWSFTKAAIEMAMNDAIRRSTGEGILEAWERERLEKVPVGISLGMFSDEASMKKTIQEALDMEYQRLKFKISPDYAHSFVFRNIADCSHPNISFDANGSFEENDFEILNRFAKLDSIIEQPFAPGSYYLKDEYEFANEQLKVCLDEEVEGIGQLIEYKGRFTELNIKPGRVGGLFNTIELMEYCFQNAIPAWIGGMFETGIGRAQNLQIASFLKEAKAHDQSPSSRYFKQDVLAQPIAMEKGFIDACYFSNPLIDEKAFQDLTVKLVSLES